MHFHGASLPRRLSRRTLTAGCVPARKALFPKGFRGLTPSRLTKIDSRFAGRCQTPSAVGSAGEPRDGVAVQPDSHDVARQPDALVGLVFSEGVGAEDHEGREAVGGDSRLAEKRRTGEDLPGKPGRQSGIHSQSTRLCPKTRRRVFPRLASAAILCLGETELRENEHFGTKPSLPFPVPDRSPGRSRIQRHQNSVV